MKRAAIWLLLIANATTAAADTVFIRDVLYVPLRGGQSSEHRILHQGIRSGTRLERLEEDEESGFSKVRTPRGLEGWIQTQYLVTEPIARDQLDRVKAELEQAQATQLSLQQDLDTARAERLASDSQIQTLSEENAALTEELARISNLAARTIEIDQLNNQLQAEQEALSQQIDDLVIANNKLNDTSHQDWFLRGAGVVALGLLFGFFIARRLYDRRSSSWS